MPRPEFSSPILPSIDSPSSLSSGKCGSSWAVNSQVRAPYKSVDKYSDVLPAIYTADFGFGSDNVEDSFPPASSPLMKSSLKKAIKGAKEILGDYDGDGYIDAANKTAIKLIIARAEKYADQAKELWDWWDKSYRPDPDQPIYGWPLNADRMAMCSAWAPGTSSLMVSLPISGPTEIEFTCPTKADGDNHDKDRDVYATLIRAAVFNIRCAQEAASAVGIYNRNIEVYKAAVGGGMKISSATPSVNPGSLLASVVPGPGDDPDEPGDEPGDDPDVPGDPDDPDEATTTATKKKKGGGALLLGAVGLGLLMMGKK